MERNRIFNLISTNYISTTEHAREGTPDSYKLQSSKARILLLLRFGLVIHKVCDQASLS